MIRENLMAILLNCMHLGISPHEFWSVLVIIITISSLIAGERFCRVLSKHLTSFSPSVMVIKAGKGFLCRTEGRVHTGQWGSCEL